MVVVKHLSCSPPKGDKWPETKEINIFKLVFLFTGSGFWAKAITPHSNCEREASQM